MLLGVEYLTRDSSTAGRNGSKPSARPSHTEREDQPVQRHHEEDGNALTAQTHDHLVQIVDEFACTPTTHESVPRKASKQVAAMPTSDEIVLRHEAVRVDDQLQRLSLHVRHAAQ